MKTKKVLILLLSTLFLFQLPTSSHAFWNRDVKKAKEFMEVDMYPDAIELLNKRIKEKPTDEEAHYLLGTCYLHQGNYNRADESFGRAIKLKPAYKQDIGKQFSKAGDNAINSNNSQRAINLYQKAIQYNPELRKSIVQTAFEVGDSYFKNGQYNLADSRFMVSANFDLSFRQKISDMYFEAGNSTGGKQSLDLYTRATSYSSSHNQEIGYKLLAVSKTAKDIKDPILEEYRNHARRFMTVKYDKSAQFYKNQASKAWGDKKLDKAISNYTIATEICPNCAKVYMLRGWVQRERGEYGSAIEDLKKAIELDPTFPTPYHWIASIYAECPKDEFRDGEKALEYVKKGISLSGKKSKRGSPTLASAYAATGDFESAIKEQEKACLNLKSMKKDAFINENARKGAIGDCEKRLNSYKAHKPWRE